MFNSALISKCVKTSNWASFYERLPVSRLSVGRVRHRRSRLCGLVSHHKKKKKNNSMFSNPDASYISHPSFSSPFFPPSPCVSIKKKIIWRSTNRFSSSSQLRPSSLVFVFLRLNPSLPELLFVFLPLPIPSTISPGYYTIITWTCCSITSWPIRPPSLRVIVDDAGIWARSASRTTSVRYIWRAYISPPAADGFHSRWYQFSRQLNVSVFFSGKRRTLGFTLVFGCRTWCLVFGGGTLQFSVWNDTN